MVLCVLGVGEGLVEVAGADTSALLNITPPKKGEQWCAALENKGTQCTRPPTHVTLQLQANMVLLCAKMLYESVSSEPENAEEISSLTCFGAQFGLTYPMKLLKLKMDFDERNMSFKELFVAPVGPASGAYMDLLLCYIFQALKLAPFPSP